MNKQAAYEEIAKLMNRATFAGLGTIAEGWDYGVHYCDTPEALEGHLAKCRAMVEAAERG